MSDTRGNPDRVDLHEQEIEETYEALIASGEIERPPGDPGAEHVSTDLTDEEIECVCVALALFAAKTSKPDKKEQALALIHKLGFPVPPPGVVDALVGA